ncbi:hypothetical protein SAMN04490243_2091 [Robiginitalea myxolifaciens]|uniref:O-antigen ligase-related domain-containing protein n=1 Tax=Robiginitalea myxolifaciens TaxID=400055 RepID=A0A1I6H1X8_9FLAO|nr:O-antigen ligase family protein [Robiginitalea myxolifaciens]SFR48418.1 hypothetical protein SAMN04490243_2091 [Robiginitalea myxolifaciens]
MENTSVNISFFKGVGIFNILLISGLIINLFNYGFLLGYLLIPTMFLFRGQFASKNWDRTGMWLMLFCVVHALFYAVNPLKGIQYILVYAAIPVTMYFWGKYMVHILGTGKKLYLLLIMIGVVLASPALLSVLLNIAEGGFVQGDRNIPMFWSETKMNATGMAAYFIFTMCLPAILATSRDRIKISYKIVLAIIYVLSMVCVLRLGSRTQLGITVLAFLTALFYVLPRQNFKRNLALIMGIMVGIIVIANKVSFDLDANWLNSFSRRIEKGGAGEVASGGGRTDRWAKSFEYMIKEPLGWDVTEFGHSHNLWLDVYRSGGVIVFVLLLYFTFRGFRDVWRAVRSNKEKIPINVIFVTYGLSFFLLFMVEPVIDGSFTKFALFCLFIGIVNKYKSLQNPE